MMEILSAMEQTFAIIKPDSVANRNIGHIIAEIEEKGFDIRAMKFIRLGQQAAKDFYIEHKDKPFYGDLVAYMTSGPVIVMVLEKDNAIKDWRELMGATNPAEAAEGTLRKRFGESIERNAVHGSANPEDAHREVYFFFGQADQVR
jgi:nucleoside-diphosphate kinase